MTLQSDVRSVFRSAASYFGAATDYRLKTAGAWSAWATDGVAEVKTFTAREEMDPMKGTVLKRQRAVAKFYDSATLDAPTLRIGDQVRRDSIVWCVDEVMPAESASGVYRYALVRDIPIAAQADRGQLPIAEGGATNEGDAVASRFSAENETGSTMFKGAIVHRTATGVALASNDDAVLDAIGICLDDTDDGDNATICPDSIVTLDDWTDVTGSADLTPGLTYYVATDGMLTTTPPTTGGGAVFSQIFGVAVSARALDVEIEEAIVL